MIIGDKSEFVLKLVCFKDVEKSDPRVIEYLQTQLIDPVKNQFTERAKQMFIELFTRYAVVPVDSTSTLKITPPSEDKSAQLTSSTAKSSASLNGVIGPEQWDTFQMCCAGEKMPPDLLKYIMETYETKTITALVPVPTTEDVKMSDVSPEGTSSSTTNNTNTIKESPSVTDSANKIQEQEPSLRSSAFFVKKEVKGTTLKGYFVHIYQITN